MPDDQGVPVPEGQTIHERLEPHAGCISVLASRPAPAVRVPAGMWKGWATVLGGSAGAAMITRALEELARLSPVSSEDGRVAVTRAHLTALAERLWPDEPETLFVLTMMWGRGTNSRNRHSFIHTLESLDTFHRPSDVPLWKLLLATGELVLEGEIARAYDVFEAWDASPKIGEAFITKWLWVVSLRTDARRPAVILDARVRGWLDTFWHGASRRAQLPYGSWRYATVCHEFDETARRYGGTASIWEEFVFETLRWTERPGTCRGCGGTV